MIITLRLFSLLATVLLPFSLLAESRPNILFLMADDLGYADVGFNGNQLVHTPNMDRMAEEGLRFLAFTPWGRFVPPPEPVAKQEDMPCVSA